MEMRESDSDELRLLEWINVILSHKFLIVILSVVAAATAYGLCKTMRPFYTAEATVIPNREAERLSLTRLFGVDLGRGAEDMIDVFSTSLVSSYYMEILRSDALLQPLVDQTWSNGKTLAQMLELKPTPYATVPQQALATLRKSVLKLRQDKSTGMISVLCTTTEAGVSAEIANQLVARLKTFLSERRFSSTKSLIKASDIRTSEAQVALSVAVTELQDFRLHNRTIGTPDLKAKDDELQRKVRIQEQILIEVKTKMEMLRLSEQQEADLIHVIQPAEVPWKKSWPPTLLATAGAGTFGLVLALVLAFVRRGIRSLAERQAPGYEEFVRNMRSLNHWLPGIILLLPRESRRRRPAPPPLASAPAVREESGS